MTTSETTTASREPASESADSTDVQAGTLQPFSGEMVTPMVFSSGKTIWLYNMQSTPTDLENGYIELWVTEPDGATTLYTDPPEATEVVSEYHDFAERHGATIEWNRTSETVTVSMEAEDGTTCECRVQLRNSFKLKLINGGTAILPDSLGLLSYEGVSETGADYRYEPERMLEVPDATASLNGADLGALQAQIPPGEYGTPEPPERNFYTTYDLYLPYPTE